MSIQNETLFRPDGTFPVNETKEYPLMKCGCIGDAVRHGDPEKKPVCALHCDTEDGRTLDRMVKGSHGLEGRRAQCTYLHRGDRAGIPRETASHWSLPFFRHRPDKPFDEFFCGCMGWD